MNLTEEKDKIIAEAIKAQFKGNRGNTIGKESFKIALNNAMIAYGEKIKDFIKGEINLSHGKS